MPVFTFDMLRELAPLAVTMTLFALTEAVSIARSISIRSGHHRWQPGIYRPGAPNIFGSFFSSTLLLAHSIERRQLRCGRSNTTRLHSGWRFTDFYCPVDCTANQLLPKAAVAGLLFLVAWN